jgi:hypothetical protein
MASIRFSAPASVFDYNAAKDADGDTPTVEIKEVLASLNGLTHDEIFSDHLYGKAGENDIANAGISGGLLRFLYSQETGQLLGTTEYSLQRKLNPSEIELLLNYTLGQWTDGIGSNFFQMRMDLGLAPQLLVDKKFITIELLD